METREHFDSISSRYDEELPAHIRRHLLGKKTKAMMPYLSAREASESQGLDCGCGTGHYVAEMERQGFKMFGFEYSQGMLGQAQKNNPEASDRLIEGDILSIPFSNDKFDFSYTINVLHHLPSIDQQIAAILEMIRVTKPGGKIIIQDFDGDNILAKIYMDYVFPLTSEIDDDETEIWVSPKDVAGNNLTNVAPVVAIEKFTLLPNFLPITGFGFFVSLERALEKVTWRRFGGHFMLVLQKA